MSFKKDPKISKRVQQVLIVGIAGGTIAVVIVCFSLIFKSFTTNYSNNVLTESTLHMKEVTRQLSNTINRSFLDKENSIKILSDSITALPNNDNNGILANLKSFKTN